MSVCFTREQSDRQRASESCCIADLIEVRNSLVKLQEPPYYSSHNSAVFRTNVGVIILFEPL